VIYAAAPVPLTPAILAKPQRGGLLALKGFLLFLVVAAIASATATAGGGNAGVREGGMLFASGISAAYIITNLQKWKREHKPIKGAAISWTVTAFLLLMCLGTFIGIGKNENTGTTPPSQSNSTPSVPPPTNAGSTPSVPPQGAAPEGNCGTGKTCRVRDNGSGSNVFVFASKEALDEFKASSGTKESTQSEMAALVFAGQVYMVPDGTTVVVLDWSAWHGWHKVRIASAGSHNWEGRLHAGPMDWV
jgi:hypothetical protein